MFHSAIGSTAEALGVDPGNHIRLTEEAHAAANQSSQIASQVLEVVPFVDGRRQD